MDATLKRVVRLLVLGHSDVRNFSLPEPVTFNPEKADSLKKKQVLHFMTI